MLHNGLEFCKAQMKLNALADASHSDEEIRKVKDFLAPQSLLPSPAPSVTAVTHRLSYTGVNRHTADTRIELMDRVLQVETLVSGVE